MVDERRSKVKPPTLHRPGVAVDGLNIQGCAMVACVPAGMLAKSPVPPDVTLLKPALPCASNQVFILVAVSRECVSNWTAPAKLMFPCMFAAGVFIPVFIPPTILQALAFWLNSAQLITPAKTARSVFDIFFIVFISLG